MISINLALAAIGVFVGILLLIGIGFMVLRIVRSRSQSKNSLPRYAKDRSRFGEDLRRRKESGQK